MPITKLTTDLWEMDFSLFGSCVYLFKYKNKNIIIDTGSRWNRSELLKFLEELKTPVEKIDLVILTHNHFDHVGNISLFNNSKIYGSKKDFSSEKILNISKLKLEGMQVVETPGHSRGGICLWFPKERILFSGDTLFEKGISGRTDIPGSNSSDMRESLSKLTKLDFKFLCPGHVID
jgi:glyoxylase-like metal-dependent hydrolase (beta-lactamase superfamily II)